MAPVVEESKVVPSPADALRAFAGSDGLILFDSALRRDRLGRYSYLAADPIATFEVERAASGKDLFESVRVAVSQLNDHFDLRRLSDLPPFQGGVAGALSYECGGCWERIPRTGNDEFELPDAWFGIYDWVIAWDHQQKRAWIVSHGLPKLNTQNTDRPERSISNADLSSCRDRAAARIQDVLGKLSQVPAIDGLCKASNDVPESELAPQHPLPGWDGVTSDFSRDAYLAAVERVIEYIHAGDIFQANLSSIRLA